MATLTIQNIDIEMLENQLRIVSDLVGAFDVADQLEVYALLDCMYDATDQIQKIGV